MEKNTEQSFENGVVKIWYSKEYLKNGNVKYVADLRCHKIAEHRIIKDTSEDIVRLKANDIKAKWEMKVKEKEAVDRVSSYNAEIARVNNEIDKILIDGLSNEYSIEVIYPEFVEMRRNIDEIDACIQDVLLKDKNLVCEESEMPIEPCKADFTVKSKFPLICYIFRQRRQNKKYKLALQEYDIKKFYYEQSQLQRNKALIERQENENKLLELKKQHETLSTELNEKVALLKDLLNNNDIIAVENYSIKLLEYSIYPFHWDKKVIASYNGEMLAVDYSLPQIDFLPILSTIKYSKGNYKNVTIKQKEITKLYNDTIYKIVLRSLSELFRDANLAYVKTIAFNGWVTVIDQRTGRPTTNCILTIVVDRDAILEIDFSKVEPKLCFNALKGISCSDISTMTPIAPIVVLNKEDKRFVQHYDVISNIDNSKNLAAMDWKDFENLIRDLFEKELESNRGEVKITRASRDGGVDAVAYDPDPIRGGKIIIQAKRYTNTVDVSAVRDLYGAVVNEGAIKGIIVTTSDYGADSYEFASDKPLTLINGNNLLYLLGKQGIHARIDIKEAKKLLSNEV